MGRYMKSNGSPTTYSLRRALGMKAKRASGFNRCIGLRMIGPAAPHGPGQGGRLNKAQHAKFTAAVQSCRGGGAVAAARAR